MSAPAKRGAPKGARRALKLDRRKNLTFGAEESDIRALRLLCRRNRVTQARFLRAALRAALEGGGE